MKQPHFDISNSNNVLRVKHLKSGATVALIMKNEDKEPQTEMVAVESSDIKLCQNIARMLRNCLNSNKKASYQQRTNKLAGQLRKCVEAKTWRVLFNQLEAKLPNTYPTLREEEVSLPEAELALA